jgi:hypothetical protein
MASVKQMAVGCRQTEPGRDTCRATFLAACAQLQRRIEARRLAMVNQLDSVAGTLVEQVVADTDRTPSADCHQPDIPHFGRWRMCVLGIDDL